MLEKSREVPRKVQEALSNDDRVALRRMGQIGGEHNAALKIFEKEKEKERIEKQQKQQLEDALQQARVGQITKEGDVLPPDQEVVAFLEEVLKE